MLGQHRHSRGPNVDHGIYQRVRSKQYITGGRICDTIGMRIKTPTGGQVHQGMRPRPDASSVDSDNTRSSVGSVKHGDGLQETQMKMYLLLLCSFGETYWQE